MKVVERDGRDVQLSIPMGRRVKCDGQIQIDQDFNVQVKRLVRDNTLSYWVVRLLFNYQCDCLRMSKTLLAF